MFPKWIHWWSLCVEGERKEEDEWRKRWDRGRILHQWWRGKRRRRRWDNESIIKEKELIILSFSCLMFIFISWVSREFHIVVLTPSIVWLIALINILLITHSLAFTVLLDYFTHNIYLFILFYPWQSLDGVLFKLRYQVLIYNN